MRATIFIAVFGIVHASISLAESDIHETIRQLDLRRGIVVVLGLPAGDAEQLTRLAQSSALTLYYQSADEEQISAVRQAAADARLLGRRIFAVSGPLDSVHLANNVADGILVGPSAQGKTPDNELLRVLRPGGVAIIGDRKVTKPIPDGIDQWSHPYHSPDNNPQSNDQLVRGALRTQFIGDPKFSPMPEQSVAAGGRIFKAMGHIAHRANQNAMLNTLLCINAYNGTILWSRPLPAGFMIHRNTMIATDDALYLGDHESCKVIDARTGQTRDQITVPKQMTDGPTWKWMALQNGTLFALIGNPEIEVATQKSSNQGLGHWPWGMWQGHDYKDSRTAFGYGRTFVAIDLKTRKVRWHYREDEFFDARGVAMNGDHIFCYSPERCLACLDARDGTLLWKNSDKELLEAIGPHGRAQHYVTGYATTCYMKCNERYVFFAGPQRKKMTVASATSGELVWTHPNGNLQLVLRPDAIYAAGPKTSGVRLDYATGKTLGSLPTRRACTRATGCADSIFYRTSGGTVRVLTGSNTAEHIAPMRPPCQDGVIVANGHLYWGPWMCGCQLSLYGNICLGPAVTTSREEANLYKDALRTGKNSTDLKPLEIKPGDWTCYRGNNARTDLTNIDIPRQVQLRWTADIASADLPTAPVVAGGLAFVADRSGVVRALDQKGRLVWKSFTGGAVYYPPAVAHDRVYVGSADGRVYAMEARTGRFLWSFRVAPEERLIPVYGRLISSWPVAGGVVVEGDTLYAAAGIAHYDKTYVVALDATTGELKASNTTSGTLANEVNNGISLQGNLKIVDSELRFLGGGVYETARYELRTLKCLNTPKVQVVSQFRTAFYPYYPGYAKFVSLDHTCPDGSTLCHDASYEGSQFSNLARRKPLPPGKGKSVREASRWNLRRGGPAPQAVWRDKANRRFTSFVMSGNVLLATGHAAERPDSTFLVAIDIEDGSDIWLHKTPADVVKGGTAIDHQGNIYVALENGQLLCFAPAGS